MARDGTGRERVFLSEVLEAESLLLWRAELGLNQGVVAQEALAWSESDLSKRLSGSLPLPGSAGPHAIVRAIASYLFEQVASKGRSSRTSIDEIQATLTRGSGADVRAVLYRVFGPVPGAHPGSGEALARVAEALGDEIRRIKNQGVPESILRLILERLGEPDVAPEDYANRLLQAAERYQAFERELRTLRAEDPAVRESQAGAEAALKEGRVQDVERLLREAAEHDRAALAAQSVAHTARRLSLAHTLRLGAMLKALILEYSPAIELLQEALRLVPADNSEIRPGLLMEMAELMMELGRFEEAEAAFHEAEGLCVDRPELVAACWNGCGAIERQRGNKERATQLFERAADAMRARGGPEYLAVLSNIASMLLEREEMKRAAALFAELRERVDRDESVPDRHRAAILNDLGERAREEGRLDEAEQLLLQALALRESAYPKSHPAIGRTLDNLGRVWLFRERVGDDVKAEHAFKRALNIFEAFGSPNRDVGVVLLNLAMLEMARSGEGAEHLARRALAVARDALANDPGQRAEAVFVLAQILVASGSVEKTIEARELLRSAIAELTEIDRNRETVGGIHNLLAMLLMQRGEYGAAEPHAKTSWQVFSVRLGEAHPRTGLAMLLYATVLGRLGDETSKARLVRRARELFSESMPVTSPESMQLRQLLWGG